MRVLLVHGAGGGAWEWAAWTRVLASRGHAPVALVLQPAADGLAATRLATYAEQVAHAARTADVLVGASLGGLLVLMAAQRRAPGALVLVNPLPPLPWAAGLPERAPYPAVIPWGCNASLASTRRALPDADAATWHWAWRQWRDESGAVMNAARAGVEVAKPACPALVVASARDDDVPAPVSRALADACGASVVLLPEASHVGPLLGRDAARTAGMVADWLRAVCALPL